MRPASVWRLWRDDARALGQGVRRGRERSPTVARIAPVVALALAFAYWAASRVSDDATFAVSARTEVVALEVGCMRPLVWDLPAGRVAALDGPRPVAADVVSVELRAGSRVRLWLGGDRRWRAALEPSDVLGCDGAGEPADAIVVAAANRRLPASAAGYYYESNAPLEQRGERPLLPLHGRIVIGDEVVFGAGTGRAVSVPLLSRARIEARTPDRLTLQRRLIHEEQIDAGGIVDSHGCLDTAGAGLRRCLRDARPAAEGFVHPGEVGDEPGFDVQMLVTGRHVGVRQHGGSERRVVVTAWSQWVSSQWLQLAAATLLFVSAMAQIWSVIERRDQGTGGSA